ncbi:hypothetical protein [Nonomuraea sp. GTA35]|uniref:hypothetical protein n=1 Tax=Nonomuraea sp. GTA35 TaxID=1676746 RepID=UPI0035C17E7A
MKTRVIQDDPDDEPPLDPEPAQIEEPGPPLHAGDPASCPPSERPGQPAGADDRPAGSDPA